MVRSTLPILLLLAACGGGEEATNNSFSDEDETVSAAPQEPVSENLSDDPNNSVVPLKPVTLPSPAASASSITGGRVPASFHGRWGMVANDCVPGRSDNKGLMEVGPMTLRFYESRGTVQRLTSPRPGRIEATLAFVGEGMEWTNTQALILRDGGRTLVREKREPVRSYSYTKCPAGKETEA